jgi:hypothetical protein
MIPTGYKPVVHLWVQVAQCKFIIPKWEQHLPFLRRFIDDKFGVWTGTNDEFKNFSTDLNSYCQLQWETDGLQSSVNFLDLTIHLNQNGSFSTKPFQKLINLHLYLPPNSAHPPRVLKSLFYGNLHRYWLQNTHVEDYITVAKQFANRLTARGYDPQIINNLFLQAAKKLDDLTTSTKKNSSNDDTLYLHWTWHPRDISKRKLCLILNNTLKEKSGFNNLIIAYSRAKNLRDSLTKTTLSEPEERKASNLLNNWY